VSTNFQFFSFNGSGDRRGSRNSNVGLPERKVPGNGGVFRAETVYVMYAAKASKEEKWLQPAD